MANVFIFAGGDNTRWNGEESKEIISVDSMPIIVRTIWQIRGLLKQEPVVITHKQDVIDVVEANRCRIINTKHDCLIESVIHQPWGEKNCILLGDVYYTDNALYKIFGTYRFAYGNKIELFAIRWIAPDSRVDVAFQTAFQHFKFHGGRGKLWEAFRALHNKPLDEHWLGGSLLMIEDQTNDFNTIEEYETWLEKYKHKR